MSSSQDPGRSIGIVAVFVALAVALAVIAVAVMR
jgi:hypothetical protein